MPTEQTSPHRSAREIQADLLDFLRIQLPNETGLDADTDLIAEEVLDSLLIMDLVAHLESVHGIRLSGRDIVPRHFRTVRVLADFLAGGGT